MVTDTKTQSSDDLRKMIQAKAAKYGDMLAQIDGLGAYLEGLAENDEKRKISVICVLSFLNVKFTKEQLDDWPEPDSVVITKHPVTGAVTHNNNPDKYAYVDKDGKAKKGNFYKDMREHVPWIKKTETLLAQWTAAQNKSTDAPAHMLSASFDLKEQEVSRLKSRVRFYTNQLRDAIKLRTLMTDLNELGTVTVSFAVEPELGKDGLPVKDANGKFINDDGKPLFPVYKQTNKPITIGDRMNSGTGETYAVSSFLLLNAKTAREKGGTYSAVINSAESKQPSPTELAAGYRNFGDFEDHVSNMVSYLSKNEVIVAIGKRVGQKPEDKDAFMWNMGRLVTLAQQVFPMIQADYRRIEAEQERAANEALAAKSEQQKPVTPAKPSTLKVA